MWRYSLNQQNSMAESCKGVVSPPGIPTSAHIPCPSPTALTTQKGLQVCPDLNLLRP